MREQTDMQCNCQDVFEKSIRERVEKDLPEGFEEYDANLQGFGFVRRGDSMEGAFLIKYQGSVMVPKKTGTGMKRHKIDISITANFCPFCGKHG
jgi:formylmethanofuran dehydrogenase subunit C